MALTKICQLTGYDKQERTRTNSRYLSSNVESSLPGLHTYGSNYKESSNITHEKNKVWIEAYGCSASKADSEMIIGQLRNCGYELATDEKESSINLVVTCSVKEATSHKMLHRINSLARSNKPIVIAGCLPKAEQEKIENLFPSASLLGPHSIDRTIDVVDAGISGKKIVALEDSLSDKINIPRIRINPTISIVEIASGCMSECSVLSNKGSKRSNKKLPHRRYRETNPTRPRGWLQRNMANID